VDSFIHDSKEQIRELSTKLDLALNYLGLLSDQDIFPQTVNIKNFLGDIIQDYSKLDLHLMDSGRRDIEDIPIHLDPALSRTAINYLLDEVALYTLGDHPVDILIEKEEQSVILIIQSGPTLPLPGLSPSDEKSGENTTNPMVHLAESIIKLHGGSVRVENYPAERGTGLRVLISLPLVNIGENNIPISRMNPVEEKLSGRVLLAESQTEYQLSIQESLGALGFRVDLATEGNAALDMVQRINPIAVIVARNLPGLDGILLTQGIRRWSAVPIIMISSRTDTEDLIRAFQAGVDDYLKKPFRMDEFQLRLKANLARSELSDQRVVPDIYHSGDIRIDYSSRLVWQRGNLVHLTPIEYRLLVYMTRQGKQIMTYEQLLNQVWEGPEKGSRQGLFVHIRRLREKIESDPEDPQIILNKWGVGYEFNP
jgi:two-component system KDP operon response regulator KdpE